MKKLFAVILAASIGAVLFAAETTLQPRKNPGQPRKPGNAPFLQTKTMTESVTITGIFPHP